MLRIPLAHGCFAVAAEPSSAYKLQRYVILHYAHNTSVLLQLILFMRPLSASHIAITHLSSTESLGVSEQNAQRQFTRLLLQCLTVWLCETTTPLGGCRFVFIFLYCLVSCSTCRRVPTPPPPQPWHTHTHARARNACWMHACQCTKTF